MPILYTTNRHTEKASWIHSHSQQTQEKMSKPKQRSEGPDNKNNEERDGERH